MPNKGGYQIIDLNQLGGVDSYRTYKKPGLWGLVTTYNKPLLFSEIIGTNGNYSPASYRNVSSIRGSDKKYVYIGLEFFAKGDNYGGLPNGAVNVVNIYEDDTYIFEGP